MSGTTKLMTAGGGGVNITPASSVSSDVTVQVPSQNCTLGIQGPAFSAYASVAQNVATGTWTKIQYNTKDFDTNSCYDNSTNYRFTPTVAGYYQVNMTAGWSTGAPYSQISVYKNGSAWMGSSVQTANGNFSAGSVLVYLNGSTDYIEIYGFQANGSAITVGGGSTNKFQAALVRAA